jgi:hypothetical protein
MNKLEVNQILEYAQNFDNRKITDGMVDAWHEVLNGIPFEIARAAVVEAFKDDSLKWLEPKHVYRFARPMLDRANVEAQREERLNELNNVTSSPMPKCKHGKGLLYCVPCCAVVKVKR